MDIKRFRRGGIAPENLMATSADVIAAGASAASYRAGSITLQLVRPDIRQSCILLADVNSCASHNPTTSRTTAIASPAIAGRRFSGCSGSLIAGAPLHVLLSSSG